MLRRVGQVRPPSAEIASVIGARGAPQNARPRVSGGAVCVAASPSSSISSYSEVRRSVASSALDWLNTNASRSSDSTTNWIDELLLGNSVGTGAVQVSPSSAEVLR